MASLFVKQFLKSLLALLRHCDFLLWEEQTGSSASINVQKNTLPQLRVVHMSKGLIPGILVRSCSDSQIQDENVQFRSGPLKDVLLGGETEQQGRVPSKEVKRSLRSGIQYATCNKCRIELSAKTSTFIEYILILLEPCDFISDIPLAWLIYTRASMCCKWIVCEVTNFRHAKAC